MIDPELGINIVDLGLIYDLRVNNDHVFVCMTLTTPGCPLHDTIVDGVHHVLRQHPDIQDVDADLVWNPPWSPERMSEKAKLQLLFFG
ncbi:metal-sulfur cluster assembly factor [Paludifilum halophilum]|uniref:FeS assembly SUF system protein n=1 Tax=Paludifilum halophilum TaxID=1642702 RepID=A0A235B2Z0_9BACL|nr:iron-sulfur cluster assembly protein [Paludifilum halophilum]OYD06678.1 FeS assembly SUF system protein [Paludifilum halophilum]